MRTPVFRHRGGFALTLELLLGMVVLLLSILALFTLFPSADKAIVNADHRTQALSLARQLMEQQMVRRDGKFKFDLEFDKEYIIDVASNDDQLPIQVRIEYGRRLENFMD